MNNISEETIESFKKENHQEGIRVFVAGGSRSGNDEVYVKEAYILGRKIMEMDFKLDFGLSNKGIMGAVAQGVIDGWSQKQNKDEFPVQGITTEKYLALYDHDDDLISKMDIVVANSLEARKQMLLNADFVVFAPGGVGTLDELAYDCVAMQDGLLPMKPFIIYNINGFYYHLLEYLKFIASEGFADKVPFIVVDNEEELEIAFHLLKHRCDKKCSGEEAYETSRRLVYELPYFVKQKTYYNISVEGCLLHMQMIEEQGTDEDKQLLENGIETAFLEQEISKMYERLAIAGRDIGTVSEKLNELKRRRKDIFK